MATATHRMVNGIRVNLRQAEIDEIEAEWTTNLLLTTDATDEDLEGYAVLDVLVDELATATGQTRDQIKTKIRNRRRPRARTP